MKWISDTGKTLSDFCNKLTKAAARIVSMFPNFALKLAKAGAEIAVEKIKRIKRIRDEEAKEAEEAKKAEKYKESLADKNSRSLKDGKVVGSPEAQKAEAEIEDAAAKGTSDKVLETDMNQIKSAMNSLGDAIANFINMMSSFTKGGSRRRIHTQHNNKTSSGKTVQITYTIPELIEVLANTMSKVFNLTTKIVKLVTTIPEKLIKFIQKIGNSLGQTVADALVCPFQLIEKLASDMSSKVGDLI